MLAITPSMETIAGSKDILKSFLLKKVKSNSSYSARAFARDIGVSAAFVTMLFNGKKKLSLNRAIDIAKALKLNDRDKESLLKSVLIENGMDLSFITNAKTSLAMLKDITEEQFSVIADWYHLVILDLTTTEDFKSDAVWIGKRLGLKPLQVEDAIQRLLTVGLLKKEKGKLVKSHQHINLPTKVSVSAVREHHRQMMEQAKLQLDKVDQASYSKRHIGSTTIAASAAKIQEAKKRIQAFQEELTQFLSSGECDEVVQLNIQFFNHTKKITKES